MTKLKTIKETCYKGTRILLGNDKRDFIENVRTTILQTFTEIQLPIIQLADIFKDKVGQENNNLMYNFTDRGSRELCLAPEYTAVIQRLASTTFKYEKDVRLFYVAECFRGEKPQNGRYRQFTQLGVEVLNPTDIEAWREELPDFAMDICELWTNDDQSYFQLNRDTSRGLDYYKEGKGFEITCDLLDSSKQICGGGEYEGGIGFAIGLDRLMLL